MNMNMNDIIMAYHRHNNQNSTTTTSTKNLRMLFLILICIVIGFHYYASLNYLIFILPQKEQQQKDNNIIMTIITNSSSSSKTTINNNAHETRYTNTNANANNSVVLKTAICVITKFVLREDLQEWVDYHFALGFNTIYMYDNSPNFELHNWTYIYRLNNNNNSSSLDDNTNTNTNTYTYTTSTGQQQRLFVRHHPGKRQQFAVYRKCISNQKRQQQQKQQHNNTNNTNNTTENSYKHDWMGFWDTDEFLVLKKHSTMNELLQNYQDYDGLGLNRISFYYDPITQLTKNKNNDSDSQQPGSSNIPVLKKFQMRVKRPDKHIKTIAKTSQIDTAHIHYVIYKSGNFNKHIDTSYTKIGIINKNDENENDDDDKNNKNNNTPSMLVHRNDRRPEDIAVIHHYETKTLEEYISKCQRGDAVYKQHEFHCRPKKEIMDHFASKVKENGGFVKDDTAWQFLINSIPYYQKYD